MDSNNPFDIITYLFTSDEIIQRLSTKNNFYHQYKHTKKHNQIDDIIYKTLEIQLMNKIVITEKQLYTMHIDLLDLVLKYQNVPDDVINKCIEDWKKIDGSYIYFKYMPFLDSINIQYIYALYDLYKVIDNLLQNNYLKNINPRNFVGDFLEDDIEKIRYFKEQSKLVEQKQWINDVLNYLVDFD